VTVIDRGTLALHLLAPRTLRPDPGVGAGASMQEIVAGLAIPRPSSTTPMAATPA
jgi:hypothetical protein